MLGEGEGIRTGDVEIHPGFGVEGGYDSNFLLRSHVETPGTVNGAPAAPPLESGRLRLTPSISIRSLQGQRLADGARPELPPIVWDLTAYASYLEFFGNPIIQRQRNVSANAHGVARIFSDRTLGFNVGAGYIRLVQPGSLGDPNLRFSQHVANGSLDMVLRPGGGALEFLAGYDFTATLLDDLGSANRIDNTGNASAVWRFTPRTRVNVSASAGYSKYINQTGTTALVDSIPVSATAGFDGLITARLSLTASVGYGGRFQQGSGAALRDFSSIIGNAALTWFISGQDANDGPVSANLALGYQRRSAPSLFGNFFISDRGYLALNSVFSKRVAASVTAGLAAITYPDLPRFTDPTTIIQTGWTDVRPDVTLFAEYRFAPMFGLNVTGRYTENISDTIINDPADAAGGFDLRWRRLEVYGGVRWFM
jgi:hypothetical protein